MSKHEQVIGRWFDLISSLGVLIAGLSQGVLLFLVASGLTLVFGVMRVLNFAHGGLYMLGAYFLTSMLTPTGAPSLGAFLLSVIGVAVIVALIGAVMEVLVLRPLAGRDQLTGLLATFGLLLAIEGFIPMFFGTEARSQVAPDSFAGAFRVAGLIIPRYDLVLLVVGVLAAMLLALLLNRSDFGKKIKAVADDPEMAEAVGISSGRVRVVAFAVGSLLAGVGGALYAPLVSLTPNIASGIIIQVFAVIIVAGLGAIWGALWVSLTLGILTAAFAAYVPEVAPFIFYIVLAIAVVSVPQGLFGRKLAVGQ